MLWLKKRLRNLNKNETSDTENALFTTLVLSFFRIISPELGDLYLHYNRLLNYAFVCGIGVAINMAVIGFVFDLGLGLYVSNAIAIFVAFHWNYIFSVGPLGYLFGLQEKPKVIEEK